MKNIVVTGGAGFIGSNLCEKLCSEGFYVISIDNFNDYYDIGIKESNIARIKESSQDRFISLKGDIRDKEFIGSAFKKYTPDGVIHLAAYAGVRPSIQNPSLYVDVNINGTVNLLECMRENNISMMIFASSSSVYGNNKKVPFSEKDNVDKPISPYAATKKAGELLCHTYSHLFGLQIACLRFFTVYGRGQRPDLAIHKFTKLIDQGKPLPFFGDGETLRDYTYIDDILDGIRASWNWMINGGKYEIFNLGESNVISLKQMVEAIENALGKKAILEKLPMMPGDVDKTYADISKAKNILGYSPKTDFRDGIKEFIKWYKNQNQQ